MRRGRVAAGLGLAFVLVIVLHVVGLGPAAARYQEIFAIAHVLGFASVAVLTGFVSRHFEWTSNDWLAVGAAVVVVSVLALASEGAQTLTARDANVGDLIDDALGIVAGACLVLAVRGRVWMRIALTALAGVSLYISLSAPGEILVARGLTEVRMPILANFDRAFEAPLVRGTGAHVERVPAPPGWPLAGEVALVVPSNKAPYAGISFHRFAPNWARFEELSFVVAAVGGDLKELTVRIHDVGHDGAYADRFNRVIEVGLEPRRVTIPLRDVRNGPKNRPLDLSHVEELVIFSTSPEQGPFLVDDLRLE